LAPARVNPSCGGSPGTGPPDVQSVQCLIALSVEIGSIPSSLAPVGSQGARHRVYRGRVGRSRYVPHVCVQAATAFSYGKTRGAPMPPNHSIS